MQPLLFNSNFKKVFIILSSLLVFTPSSIFAQENYKDIIGIWQGSLEANSTSLRVVFKIKSDTLGGLIATFDSPDQGALDLPILKAYFNNDSLRLDAKVARAEFIGKLNRVKNTIDGAWHQSGISLPLTMIKVHEAIKLERPQEPKPPFTYLEEEVTILNEKENIQLSGTLTFPKGDGKFPLVILITGSGPQNRNEELLGHKPFLVIADYLTKEGFAVLRCDDRGVGKSTGNFSKATTLDFTSDILAVVEFAKKHPKIDVNKIGLLGHSEGGLIAPLAALSSKDIKYIVLLAGPGLSGGETLKLQTEIMLRSGGMDSLLVNSYISFISSLYNLIQSINNNIELENSLFSKCESYRFSLTEKEQRIFGVDSLWSKKYVQQITTEWFKYFVKYDPAPTLMALNIPVLALIGEKDFQVPAKQNIPAIEEALSKSGSKNYLVKKMPGLNHLFQNCKTGLLAEYSQISETISNEALKLIRDWLKERVN